VVGGPCGDEYSRVQLFTYTLVVGIGVLVVCGAGHPTVEAAENLFGRGPGPPLPPPPRMSGYDFEYDLELEYEYE